MSKYKLHVQVGSRLTLAVSIAPDASVRQLLDKVARRAKRAAEQHAAAGGQAYVPPTIVALLDAGGARLDEEDDVKEFLEDGDRIVAQLAGMGAAAAMAARDGGGQVHAHKLTQLRTCVLAHSACILRSRSPRWLAGSGS